MAGLLGMSMAAILGAIGGGIVAMLVAGRLAAWLIRKISGVAKTPSYVIGVSIMTIVGAWLATRDGGPGFLETWILFVIAAAIALPLIIVSDRKKGRAA